MFFYREFPHDLPNPNNPNKTFTKQFSACVDCPAIVQETTGLDAFNATEFCCGKSCDLKEILHYTRGITPNLLRVAGSIYAA